MVKGTHAPKSHKVTGNEFKVPSTCSFKSFSACAWSWLSKLCNIPRFRKLLYLCLFNDVYLMILNSLSKTQTLVVKLWLRESLLESCRESFWVPPFYIFLSFLGILMPGSISAGQLGNMTILNQATVSKQLNMVTSSVVTSQAGNPSVFMTSQAGNTPGFITTTLRNVVAPQTSVASIQSQPTSIQAQQVRLYIVRACQCKIFLTL